MLTKIARAVIVLALLMGRADGQGRRPVRTTLRTDKASVIVDSSSDGSVQKKVKLKRRDDLRKHGLAVEALDEEIVKCLSGELFDIYAVELGFSSRDVVSSAVKQHGADWSVEYQQAINGVPVCHTSVTYSIEHYGSISPFEAQYYPNIECETRPRTTPQQALDTVMQNPWWKGAHCSTPVLTIVEYERKFYLSWMIDPGLKHITAIYVSALTGGVVKVDGWVE